MNYIIIRHFLPSDQYACKQLIREGTMSTTNAAFIAGLTRELTFQAMILLSALMYIFIQVPFQITLMSIPIVIVFMYICIYLGHLFKAIELTQEVIPRMYMSSADTGFWVAEAYEPFISLKTPDQCLHQILTENEAKLYGIDLNLYQRKLVGTIAITRNRYDERTAWLRRMAVTAKYRRKGIAKALVQEAVRFCHAQGYLGVELVTSECHDAARVLYSNLGFEMKQMYHRPILGPLASIVMYEMILQIKPNNTYNLLGKT